MTSVNMRTIRRVARGPARHAAQPANMPLLVADEFVGPCSEQCRLTIPRGPGVRASVPSGERRASARRCSPHRLRPAGMTLLEVILSLALTSLVLVLIGMAVRLNLLTLDSRRSDVEQAQLARAILRHMAADLRSAVCYRPVESSDLPDTGGNVDGMAGGLAGTIAPGVAGNADPGGQAGAGTSSQNNTNIQSSTQTTAVPGLYGNQYELQVDTSRLPRVDQYNPGLAGADATTAVDIPSDVKTVAYYLRTADETGTAGTSGAGASATEATTAGLVRRERDRAVTSYAAQNGGLESSTSDGQLLAPEVNRLEFRYFDGTEWATEWDATERNGLPVAVEITLGFTPLSGSADTADVAQLRDAAALTAEEELVTYRLVVRLPVAEPTTTEGTTVDAGQEALGL